MYQVLNSRKMHSVLSLLSFLLKAPMVPPGTPVVNALFPSDKQYANIMRACVGLPAENYMLLENRTKSAGKIALAAAAQAVKKRKLIHCGASQRETTVS